MQCWWRSSSWHHHNVMMLTMLQLVRLCSTWSVTTLAHMRQDVPAYNSQTVIQRGKVGRLLLMIAHHRQCLGDVEFTMSSLQLAYKLCMHMMDVRRMMSLKIHLLLLLLLLLLLQWKKLLYMSDSTLQLSSMLHIAKSDGWWLLATCKRCYLKFADLVSEKVLLSCKESVS